MSSIDDEYKKWMALHEMSMSDDPETAIKGRVAKHLIAAYDEIMRDEQSRSTPLGEVVYAWAEVIGFLHGKLCKTAFSSFEEAEPALDILMEMIENVSNVTARDMLADKTRESQGE